MKTKISYILLSILASASLCAQTTTIIQGNLNVQDDPATANVVEGNIIASNSLRIGANASTTDSGTFAIGTGATVYGTNSFAFGTYSRAGTDGENSTANFAIGHYAKSTMDGFAVGRYTTASSPGAIAIGNQSLATGGNYALALGGFTTANGYGSSALGLASVANTSYSLALGHECNSSGYASISVGIVALSNGFHSSSFGVHTTAIANASTAIGYYTTANSYMQTTLGAYNDPAIAGTTNSTTVWNANDPLFVIGNGKKVNDVVGLSNALVMLKNGNTTFSGSIKAPTIKVTEPAGGIPMGDFGIQE